MNHSLNVFLASDDVIMVREKELGNRREALRASLGITETVSMIEAPKKGRKK